MSAQQKTYSMTLPEFSQYLTDKVNELRACYKETEEVQFQFNDIFKRELAAWQGEFSAVFPRVLTQRRELPAPFVAQIDQAEQEELAELKQEMDTLHETIAQNQQQGDALLHQAQEASATLSQANPELNSQEETTKAQLTTKEDAFAQAYEQIEALERGLGWLANAGKIARLKREQSKIKAEQAQLLLQLRDTRKTWQARLEETGTTQSDLRQQWETLGVATSQAQARYDFITANIDNLAQQQAITRFLTDLQDATGIEGELGELLAKLVERNKVRSEYEVGLRSVAEALGLTKGVAEGVERFAKSVAGVVDEQTRFNLANVSVELPQWVINVVETWKPLRERVKDEKYLGTQPLEFSQIVKSYISDRITDDIIKRFFETMGDALTAATSAWS